MKVHGEAMLHGDSTERLGREILQACYLLGPEEAAGAEVEVERGFVSGSTCNPP